MSNFQEQSLNEDVVFVRVRESSPEFLHCEGERCALECLLSAGPSAFYTQLNAEQLGPFLSPEEVNQVSGWAQDYRSCEVLLEEEGEGEEGSSGVQDFSTCYFPVHSDTPAPCLALGWPERGSWMDMGHATIYTSPPTEQAPPIREVVRRHLQGANRLIAVVTDRLTDSAVIGDLHCAASRGVPVYIILNQRSVQENFTPHRLRHPNIRVRMLGGKTFCSRNGKMVVGELKENFVLVDLETVILGSYSLTWTDAHLHRQLVTVMSGPAVESFDREFRVLYAASLPIPDTWKAGRPMMATELFDLGRSKPAALEGVSSPPPPPTDSPLDWEALGVIQRKHYFPESPVKQHVLWEEPLQHHLPTVERQTAVEGGEFKTYVSPVPLDEGKKLINISSETKVQTDQTSYRTTPKPERTLHRLFSSQRSTELEERQGLMKTHDHRKDMSQREELMSTQRRDHLLRRDKSLEESVKPQVTMPSPQTGIANSKKAPILGMPQTESFSSLSAILKRIQSRQNSSGPRKKGAKSVVSDISKSMMDLSTQHTDKAPRSQCYDSLPQTPALTLMKKRNDEIKSGILRPPKIFLARTRPRSSSFGLHRDWRTPQRDQRREEDK